jgi:hypothetical protein
MSRIQLILTLGIGAALARYFEHLPRWLIILDGAILAWNTTSLLFKLED